MTADVYGPDADALINVHKHFPDDLDLLRILAEKKRLCLVGGVYREILRGTDRLRTAVERWVGRGAVLVEADLGAEYRFARLRVQDSTAQTEPPAQSYDNPVGGLSRGDRKTLRCGAFVAIGPHLDFTLHRFGPFNQKGAIL